MILESGFEPMSPHLSAFTISDELTYRNRLPASDLQHGWIINSGASAHMTLYKADCLNIEPTSKQIFLADGSTVFCKQMGSIHIPLRAKGKIVGKSRLDDVLIVPDLDQRLFSVNAFLSRGNNWVHFTSESIELGIQNGPKIQIPLSSLQSQAMIVKTGDTHTRLNACPACSKQNVLPNKKQLNSCTLHDQLHRPDSVLATIKAHDLWADVDISHGNDKICTSCKIMTIPAASRGNQDILQYVMHWMKYKLALYPIQNLWVYLPNLDTITFS